MLALLAPGQQQQQQQMVVQCNMLHDDECARDPMHY
jgi:hypothetical protein